MTVKGCYSSFSLIIYAAPKCSVLEPLLSIVYTFHLLYAIESNMIAYADDTPILAAIPSQQDRQRIAIVLTHDMSRILSFCDF